MSRGGLLLKFAAFSGVGLSGYYLGTRVERNNVLHSKKIECEVGGDLKRFPGLPVFGTVSAATPIPAEGSAVSTNRVSQIMKYGFPGFDNVRSFDDFVLSYDRRNRVAHWVFEHMTKESLKRNDAVDRSKCDFKPDETIHPYFRSQNSDYLGSGFDRGHLAAAGNHRLSQKHCEQTFHLTNMAPQVGNGFNRHSWNRLEMYVRKLTKVYDNVYCCTGPLYLPAREADGKSYIKYQVIGANTVAVPTHFYKIVVGEMANGDLEMEAYCMPNKAIPDETPLASYLASLLSTPGDIFLCSAIIVALCHILTAAHCGVLCTTRGSCRVGVNSLSLGLQDKYAIRSVVNHPDYRIRTNLDGSLISIVNDISLIVLDTCLTLGTTTLNSIPLDLTQVPNGEIVTTFGWGDTDATGITPDALRQTTLTTVPCEPFQPGGSPPPGFLCANGTLTATCSGDSGGPLVYRGRLAGVDSYGSACDLAQSHQAFSAVAYHSPWIATAMAENLCLLVCLLG